MQQREHSWLQKVAGCMYIQYSHHHHHRHLPLNCKGRWGTTDDFATSFLLFFLFSTALWDLANSRPVHSLMSFHLLLCLPRLLPPFTVPCRMVLARPENGRHDYTMAWSIQWKAYNEYGKKCVKEGNDIQHYDLSSFLIQDKLYA